MTYCYTKREKSPYLTMNQGRSISRYIDFLKLNLDPEYTYLRPSITKGSNSHQEVPYKMDLVGRATEHLCISCTGKASSLLRLPGIETPEGRVPYKPNL